jgi:YfiH family protein
MTQNLRPQVSEALYSEVSGFGCSAIRHGFFGRRGGVSTGLYSSLNCGNGSDDDQAAITQNRRIVAEQMGCVPEKLLSLYQIHSAECLIVREPWAVDQRPQADGMVTDVAGLALGILTADCGPVLFHGTKADGSPVIGAAHAGWGGALKGILGSTVQMMEALGAELESIRAAIGPCIGQSSYEVRDEFAEAFLKEDLDNDRFFMAGRREGHLMFDLAGYCALKLAMAGVGNVFIQDVDTCADEDGCFSYRRKTHRGEQDYGRQISVIMIKAD